MAEPRYRIIDFDQLPAVACPCGTARRALTDVAELPATVHRTRITADARLHYHRRLSETYYILECGPEARMQLDDRLVALRPGLCIYIPPGVRGNDCVDFRGPEVRSRRRGGNRGSTA